MKNKAFFPVVLMLALSYVFAQNPAAVMAEGGQGDPLEEAQKRADKIVKETPPPFDAASMEGWIRYIYLKDPKSKKILKSYAGLMKIESVDEHFIECKDPGLRSTCKEVGTSVVYRFKVKELTKDMVICCYPGDICNDCWLRSESSVENIQGEAFELKIRFLNNLVTDVALEREGQRERDHYWVGFEHKSLFPMDISRFLSDYFSTNEIPMKHSMGTFDPKTLWTNWKDEEPVVMVFSRELQEPE